MNDEFMSRYCSTSISGRTCLAQSLAKSASKRIANDWKLVPLIDVLVK
jgi:hypothetical protein